jgi:aspartyl-tRNA(Asn)/glutamyl-tRNA(Gln) amidotransferase subunit C
MSLTLMDVRAIAELARLELERDEEEAMLGQLNAFFRIVEQMGTVDTSGVEPLYTPLSAVQAVQAPLRDDVVTENDHRAENLQNAPAADAGLFLVPRVIE